MTLLDSYRDEQRYQKLFANLDQSRWVLQLKDREPFSRLP